MVDNVMSVSRNGVSDWLIQRVTAVILAAYLVFLLGFILVHPQLSYRVWHNLFANSAMRAFSFFALVSMALHTWTGLWTILTDYVRCACARVTLEVLVILSLFGFVVWGVEILWRL